jgi:hypothetical protein
LDLAGVNRALHVELHTDGGVVTSSKTLRVASTSGGVTQSLKTRTSFVLSAIDSNVVVSASTSGVVAREERLAEIAALVFRAHIGGVVEHLTGVVGAGVTNHQRAFVQEVDLGVTNRDLLATSFEERVGCPKETFTRRAIDIVTVSDGDTDTIANVVGRVASAVHTLVTTVGDIADGPDKTTVVGSCASRNALIGVTVLRRT